MKQEAEPMGEECTRRKRISQCNHKQHDNTYYISERKSGNNKGSHYYTNQLPCFQDGCSTTTSTSCLNFWPIESIVIDDIDKLNSVTLTLSFYLLCAAFWNTQDKNRKLKFYFLREIFAVYLNFWTFEISLIVRFSKVYLYRPSQHPY